MIWPKLHLPAVRRKRFGSSWKSASALLPEYLPDGAALLEISEAAVCGDCVVPLACAADRADC